MKGNKPKWLWISYKVPITGPQSTDPQTTKRLLQDLHSAFILSWILDNIKYYVWLLPFTCNSRCLGKICSSEAGGRGEPTSKLYPHGFIQNQTAITDLHYIWGQVFYSWLRAVEHLSLGKEGKRNPGRLCLRKHQHLYPSPAPCLHLQCVNHGYSGCLRGEAKILSLAFKAALHLARLCNTTRQEHFQSLGSIKPWLNKIIQFPKIKI